MKSFNSWLKLLLKFRVRQNTISIATILLIKTSKRTITIFSNPQGSSHSHSVQIISLASIEWLNPWGFEEIFFFFFKSVYGSGFTKKTTLVMTTLEEKVRGLVVVQLLLAMGVIETGKKLRGTIKFKSSDMHLAGTLILLSFSLFVF